MAKAENAGLDVDSLLVCVCPEPVKCINVLVNLEITVQDEKIRSPESFGVI